MRQTSGELKALETKLQGKKELQRQVLGLCQDQARPRRAESAEIRESPRRIPAGKRERFYHSRRRRPVFQGAVALPSCPPGKRCRPRSSSLSPRKTACITPITNRNSGSRSCRPSSGTSTRFCAGTSRTAERSRAMSDKPAPHGLPPAPGRRGGWYMSAVTTTRGTACCWTTGSLACASRAFPIPSCAAGSVWLSCPLTGSWPQPSCTGGAGNGAPSAGRPLSPNPTGENTAPTAPGA